MPAATPDNPGPVAAWFSGYQTAGYPKETIVTTKRVTKKWMLSGAAMVAVLATMNGCSKATEPFRDAPRSGTVNNKPADVVEMPDGFSNVATKCDHGNRIYVAFHGDKAYASIAVVPNDPSCAG
jgi:hypothetical protein